LGTPPRNEGLPLIGEYMTDKPIMRDPMDSEEAKELGIHQFINATKEEIELIRRLLENSIKYGFSERECNIIYRLSAFDLLTASESKSAIMLMAQKLGNIPIPKEDNE
tara:strand:+ start:205 stop:528 length:324 start_codon:yes stop_codon:yes gene_type:complete